MRIPEEQELKRLEVLYGRTQARRILEQRQVERAKIKPWIASGMSLKKVCQQLVWEREPSLYRWKRGKG